ncbi:hypothetical protein CONCODRAFT_73025 [Conidiobolus coronatus NRRL 28638]|uniref:Uncharacterized protein n=1 Tax=Conidiobolus coronatus (strain ATCC 28846 / CBS 209.66 / NRRL 28638) TaxID=796925 RepID=A0A137NX83_CONC2|nr:hypothetical protein CONCODRAFT_73025 [Conidiobolus coronatus NRRL 28638]|eukprot:KXN67376.1 hypothetical protein CONCODRAFT_73025 [Conidiobolus coronatus NRRL 28638]
MLIYSITRLLYIHLAYCIPTTLTSSNENQSQLSRRFLGLDEHVLKLAGFDEQEFITGSAEPVVRSTSVKSASILSENAEKRQVRFLGLDQHFLKLVGFDEKEFITGNAEPVIRSTSVKSASIKPENTLRAASVSSSPIANQVQPSYGDYFKNYERYEIDFNQDSDDYSYQH